MKKNLSSLLIASSIVLAALILGSAFLNRNSAAETISVTGLSKVDFTSDLIVWEAKFSKTNYDLKEAYKQLSTDKEIIFDYLISKGLNEEEIVFSSVNSRKNTRSNYSPDGKYIGDKFTGYQLSQSVEIQSKRVENVEIISREITELLFKGVELYSYQPRYYYTKLSELKVEMISKATQNAHLRAEMIAENSNAKLGKLSLARMGVFQITGQNSNENYSWGGTYNTDSKEKTASITVKLSYRSK